MGLSTEEVTVAPGEVWWCEPGPGVGREHAGRRPAVVISGSRFHDLATTLAIIVPVTTTDRGWLNHVPLGRGTGLGRDSFAMTEQVRAVSRRRLVSRAGSVSPQTLAQVRRLVSYWLE